MLRFHPSHSDILLGSSTPSPLRQALLEDESTWPIHVKRTTRADLDALSVHSGTPESLATFLDAKKYIEELSDENSVYSSVPPRSAREVPLARCLTAAHIDQLLSHGIIEKVSDPASVLGFINVFLVKEPTKRRFRIIQHTKDINEFVDDAPKVSFTPLQRRCEHVHYGSHMLDLDWAAFYNQLPVSPAIRPRLVFRAPHPSGSVSQLYQLTVGPTGQSHMVYTAVSITRHVLAFDQHSNCSDDHIDNVLFVGTRAAVIRDATITRDICKKVKITINDVDDDTDLSSLARTQGDWCGIHLNMDDKTVSLTEKLVGKLHLSWSLREGWSWRGFAAHMGLLFYAMQIINLQPFRYFNLLRFISRVSQDMQNASDLLWDAPCSIPASALTDLESMTNEAASNKPRLVPKPSSPNVKILVDASSHGWGYVAHDLVSGKVVYYGEQWSKEFVARHGRDKLRRSTFAEPWAILLMKRHLMPQLPSDGVTRHLHIGTDSVTAAALHRKGYSGRSFDLNTVATADRLEFPLLVCTLIHVEGVKNVIADALSRGKALPFDKSIGQQELENWMKSSLQQLLGVSNPGGTLVGGGKTAEHPIN